MHPFTVAPVTLELIGKRKAAHGAVELTLAGADTGTSADVRRAQLVLEVDRDSAAALAMFARVRVSIEAAP